MRDAESGEERQLFLGRKQRAQYREAVAKREATLTALLGKCGWRSGILHEGDGRHSLLQTFGLQ